MRICKGEMRYFVPALAVLLSVSATQAGQVEPGQARPHPVDAFFARGPVPRLKVEIAQKEMDALRREPRKYVRATIREIEPGQPDKVYADVGLHLKGRAGSFRGVDDRPGLTIDFGRFDGTKKFHGLSKLSLNNSVQDPTYLSEYIGRRLFREAGLPTPRAGHARIWLNGKDLGLYVLLEGLDRPFLKRSFGDGSGMLFEGNLQEIDQPLDVNLVRRTTAASRPAPGSPEADKADAEAQAQARAELKKLAVAMRERDPALRRKQLEEVLDVERFYTLMAMEVLTAHWDGYCGNRNNYRIYQDPRSGKFIFLAHGMDQLFGQNGFPLVVGNGMLAQALLALPEDRSSYLERVAELRHKVLVLETMTKWLDEVAERTIPPLAEFNPGLAQQHKAHVEGMKRRIAERIKSVDQQLAAMPRPLKFDASGVAATDNWTFQQQAGQATMDRVEENGKPKLRIRSGQGGCVASLRTTVLLPKGKYVFEGQCRAVGVEPADANIGGVGLRISGGTRTGGLNGDSGWKPCEYALEIGEASRQVVLVCEVRVKAGEGWFDPESLKLRKK